MTPPNDMPADTELRAKVHAIILKTDDYMKFCAIQDMPWNRSGNLLDELMQLIKQRDEAKEREIRIDELTSLRAITLSNSVVDDNGDPIHPPTSLDEAVLNRIAELKRQAEGGK